MTSRDTIEALERLLLPHGLITRGGFNPPSGRLDGFPDGSVGSVILIGNAGSTMWPSFRAHPIFEDGLSDPLNRWIEHVVGSIAATLDAHAVYAHQGPPYLPFLTWASRCDAVSPSPLGLFVHPDYGLWHAYRAALLFAAPIALPAPDRRPFPCDACRDRPCTSACPIPGNDLIQNHVQGCAGSGRPEGQDCRLEGCRSRRACPVGERFKYVPDHMRFHTEAFLRSHGF